VNSVSSPTSSMPAITDATGHHITQITLSPSTNA
jgi:hypothetical protein